MSDHQTRLTALANKLRYAVKAINCPTGVVVEVEDVADALAALLAVPQETPQPASLDEKLAWIHRPAACGGDQITFTIREIQALLAAASRDPQPKEPTP